MFLKLTYAAATGCNEEDDEIQTGKEFIINTDEIGTIEPEAQSSGSILMYREKYSKKYHPHIHVRESVEEIWSSIDSRFLATLSEIR